MLAVVGAAPSTTRAAPLADSRCPAPALLPADFTRSALDEFQRLVVQAPGRASHGAIRNHASAGHVDPQGHAWQRVSVYPANLALLGVLHASGQALPQAEAWLRWQARELQAGAAAPGVLADRWVRADTLEASACPDGLAPSRCHAVDAHDSTAASLLLAADAYLRHGGDAALLREPALQQALADAAGALQRLRGPQGLTWAKPDHRVAYTMDQVEVAAGWRAWSRLLRKVQGDAVAADAALVHATALEAALRRLLARPSHWQVSLAAAAPRPDLWYPDTVAQAWPLLWLPGGGADAPADALRWRRAIAGWQAPGQPHWARHNPDPDGFWWPAAAVASLCAGDAEAAHAFLRHTLPQLAAPAAPFAWPFQVGDLLWLLWLAAPVPVPTADASAPAPSDPDNPTRRAP